MDIDKFFKELNENIRNSETKKALKLLDSKARKFVKSIENNNLLKTSVKKEILKKYKLSKKLIKKKEKSLN